MSSEIKNASSWKLNKAEVAELQRRVGQGEDEQTVKRELQQKKAEASRDRRASAQAVATKVQTQGSTKNRVKPATGLAPDSVSSAQAQDATNRGYFMDVEADIHRILAMYGQDFVKEKPLKIEGPDPKSGGIQDCYDQSKALAALNAHGCYRCSISIWSISLLSSPTPGIPLSRRRVEDLSEFYFGPEGRPRFHTDRMVELACSLGDIQETVTNLQVISPEEILHATLAGCSRCIKLLDMDSCSFLLLSSFEMCMSQTRPQSSSNLLPASTSDLIEAAGCMMYGLRLTCSSPSDSQIVGKFVVTLLKIRFLISASLTILVGLGCAKGARTGQS